MATQRTGPGAGDRLGVRVRRPAWLGLLRSVHFDLPAAPSILVTLTSLLVLQGTVQALTGRGRKGLLPGAGH